MNLSFCDSKNKQTGLICRESDRGQTGSVFVTLMVCFGMICGSVTDFKCAMYLTSEQLMMYAVNQVKMKITTWV